MRTKSLLFGLLAVALMASCSKDEPTPVNGEAGQQAPVTITVKKANFSTGRAVADGQLTAESTINDLTVFVFRADGTIDASVVGATPTEVNAAAGTASLVMNNTTTAAKEFVVVANAPAGTFTQGMSKAAVMAKIMTIAAADDSSSKLVMANQTAVSATLDANKTATENAVAVTISRLAAKVQLDGLTVNLDAATYPSGTTLNVTDIYLANVNNQYNIAGNAGLVNPLINPVTVAPTTDWAAKYTDVNHTVGTPTTLASVPFYYLAPNPKATGANDATWATGTQLIIKATYSIPATGATEAKTGTTYYTIFVNRALAGTTLTQGPDAVTGTQNGTVDTGINANTIYTIAVNITKLGTDNPGEKILPAACTVNVSINPWLSVGQTVEF